MSLVEFHKELIYLPGVAVDFLREGKHTKDKENKGNRNIF